MGYQAHLQSTYLIPIYSIASTPHFHRVLVFALATDTYRAGANGLPAGILNEF